MTCVICDSARSHQGCLFCKGCLCPACCEAEVERLADEYESEDEE